MNKDEIKGTVNDAKGRVERQVGEWTGDKDAQAEGMKDQLKGKIQKGVGKVKDAGNKIADDIKGRRDDVDRDIDRDEKVA